MTSLRWVVSILTCVLALALGERLAQAQATIAIVNETSLPRVNAEGATIQKRPLTLNPEGVNLQDCIDDQRIRFTLQMANFEANASVQAWASNNGANCNDVTSRSGGVQVCWRVTDSDIALQSVVDVIVPVRRIMSGAQPKTAREPDSSPAICGQVNLTTLTIHFLYFSPGNTATPASSKNVNVVVDTIGPDPPSGLRVKPGNTRITVEWNSISGGSSDASSTGATSGTGLTALTGVKVYCDPVSASAPQSTPNPPICTDVPVDAGVDDAGNPIDGGTTQSCVDGGTTTTEVAGSCASSNFVKSDGSRVNPDAAFDAKYSCGNITGNSGTTVIASEIAGNPLANGTRYAVAVAATDAYGNVGPLSSVLCEIPEETTDFWEQYKAAGGDAGGCSTTGDGFPTATAFLLFLVVSTSASAYRRRRSRNLHG